MAKDLGTRIRNFVQARWKVILAVLGVLAIIFFVSLAAGGGAASPATELQTAVVVRGNLTATIGATGSVRAIQSATLIWQTSGTVDKVTVEVGEDVDQDQVLASLQLTSLPQNVILAQNDLQAADDALQDFYDSYGDLGIAQAQKTLADAQDALEAAQADYNNASHPGGQTNIDQAFANMVLAKDRLDKAREDYEPYANKPENNLTRANLLIRFTQAQQEYDSAVRVYNSYANPSNQTGIDVASAELALAKAQLAKAQRDYEKVLSGPTAQAQASAEARVAAAEATLKLATVEAPFAGTVTDAFSHEGDLVSAGVIAFQLDNLGHLLVDVDVSEVDINRVQIGQPATITLDAAPDTEYHGEVVAVAMAGAVDQGAVNFRVTVELSDADEFVRPGMTAGVNIVVTELQDVLLVPNRAVRIQDGKRVVYVLINGQLQPVAITLGASSETYSEVVGGDLQEGDTLVLNPPSFTFDPGQPPPQGVQNLFGGGQ